MVLSTGYQYIGLLYKVGLRRFRICRRYVRQAPETAMFEEAAFFWMPICWATIRIL
jgi:hypothetical protein